MIGVSIEAIGVAALVAFLVSGCAFKLHPLDAHGRRNGLHDLIVHRPAVLGRLGLDHVAPSIRKPDHEAIGIPAMIILHLNSIYATVAHLPYATVEAWPQGFFYATVAQSEVSMSTIPTNRESDRFMLRLPDGMRDRIKAAAEAANRSMNAEIVATLEEAYPAPRTASDRMGWIISELEAIRKLMSERMDIIVESQDGKAVTAAISEVKVLAARARELEQQFDEIAKEHPLTSVMAGHALPHDRSGK